MALRSLDSPTLESASESIPFEILLRASAEDAARRHLRRKSRLENLRKPISFAAAAVFCLLLVFVRPRGFGSLPMDGMKLLGLFLVFTATLGRILCTLYIGGRKDRELCQSGIYALCRNPLYFFSFLGLTGICLAAGNLTLTLVAGFAFLILYRTVIREEERKLQRLFPEEFEIYQRSVPRFWPRRWPAADLQVIRIQTRVFIRSLRDVLWFLVAVVGVEAIGILRTHGLIHDYPGWF